MSERSVRRGPQICKGADDVWKAPGEYDADAEPKQQGYNAEKHSIGDTGRGPHGPESIPNLHLCLFR